MDGKQRIYLEWPYVFVIVLQFHYTHVYTVQYYGTGDKLVQPTSIYIHWSSESKGIKTREHAQHYGFVLKLKL